MNPNERTPLPRDVPNYLTYPLDPKKSKKRSYLCCIYAVLLVAFMVTLLIGLDYSISRAIDISNENLLKSINEAPNRLTAAEWKEGFLAGQQAVDNRLNADSKVALLMSPSPNSRQRRSANTIISVGQLAMAAAGEIAATQKIEYNRRLLGKPSAIGAYFDGGWAPKESCKEFSTINCTMSRYRSYDGSCNHEKQWGSSLIPFRRALPPDYSDGINEPREGKDGNSLPSARTVSLGVHSASPSKNQSFSVWLAAFGQLLDEDVIGIAMSRGQNGSSLSCCSASSAHTECFPVIVGPGDFQNESCMEYVRSAAAPQCKLGPRQQLNLASSFIDGSMIYGSDAFLARDLRELEGGRLRVQRTVDNVTLLPASTDQSEGCNLDRFLIGDARANQNFSLTIMHLLWTRQHNRIADILFRLNSSWDDEKLFQEARHIVIAQLQHITYNEFLPVVLGEAAMTSHNLKPLTSGYRAFYDPKVNPTIGNNFATAAFRFVDNLLPNLMRGPKASRPIPHRSDLDSLNVQRGRDHGLPGYSVWKHFCEFSQPRTFSDLEGLIKSDIISALAKVYPSVESVDLYTGGQAEMKTSDGLLGPTLICLIADQFARLQIGDRFWYETSEIPQAFTEEQLREVRKSSLARMVCDNLDIKRIQQQAMRTVSTGDPVVSCEDIPGPSFDAWIVNV